MRSKLFCALALLMFPLASSAEDDFEITHSEGSLESATGESTWTGLHEKYFSDTPYNRKNRYEQSEYLYRITVVDENAFVFFTKSSHSAHPSFAKITLIKDEGSAMTVRTFGFTWGDDASYQDFMKNEVLEFSKLIATRIQAKSE